jgi:ribosomal protein S12 methylthiotransferase accessory factor
MEMLIDFPGGARVDAHFGAFTVSTDQPSTGGGKGEYPTPFLVFLSSIGTCAGIYVLGFCRQRGLPTDGITINEEIITSPTSGMVEQVNLKINLPASFPEKYLDAMIRSVEQCTVKKHIEHPPHFEIATVIGE